jgi:hypothetical protein
MRGRAASAVLIGSALLSAIPAFAEQLLLGKRLSIRNPPSGTNCVVHQARDVNLDIGQGGDAADPRCSGAGGGGASSLRIATSGGAGDVIIPLPCAGWTANAANTL